MARIHTYLGLLEGADPFLRDFLMDMALQDPALEPGDVERFRMAAWPELYQIGPPEAPFYGTISEKTEGI